MVKQTNLSILRNVGAVSSVLSDSATMDCSPPGSSVHGISQARMLERVAISFSRRSSWPRDRTWVSCVAGRFFITEPAGGSSAIQRQQLSTHSDLNASPENYAELKKPAQKCYRCGFICIILEIPNLRKWMSLVTRVWGDAGTRKEDGAMKVQGERSRGQQRSVPGLCQRQCLGVILHYGCTDVTIKEIE